MSYASMQFMFFCMSVGTPILLCVIIVRYFDYKMKESARLSKQDDVLHQRLLSENDELRDRLQALETIVTDQGYALDDKIRAIGR